jgi:ABC-type amino acid transport substrate-binding protein
MAGTTDCPAFVELFNLLLSEMNADGSLAALYAQYGLSLPQE